MDYVPPRNGLEALCRFVHGVLAVLGTWQLESAQAVQIYNRIGRLPRLIGAMMQRWRDGTLRVGATRTVAPRQAKATRAKPAVVLPRRYGWLAVAGKYQACGFGCQLQYLLLTPEMADFLAAAPQAKRLLRPICRALAVELPWVKTVRVRKTPVTPRPKRVRKRWPDPPVYKIPLSREIIAAARKYGYGRKWTPA